VRINNRELMADLRNKMPTTSVYFRIKRIYDKYGPMSDEVAACVLADQIGLNLNRYDLAPETFPEVRRVKALIRESETQTAKSVPKPTPKTTKTPTKRPINVNIAQKFKLTDHILPKDILKDAEEMTEVYALIYVLENSMRELIIRVLTHYHGEGWWDDPTVVPPEINTNAQNRKNKEREKGVAWHGRRAENIHLIHYTYMGDLVSIIKKNWDLFEPIGIDKNALDLTTKNIRTTRDISMHCNPISEADKKDLEHYFSIWERTLKNNRHLIPEINESQ